MGKGRGSFVTTTTTNGRSRGCCDVGIERPREGRFEVRKLEARRFPWSLRATVEWSHPCGAGHEDCVETDSEGPQDHRPAICVLGEVEVSLEGLVARELAPVRRLGSARAWAAPDVGEEALAAWCFMHMCGSLKDHRHRPTRQYRSSSASAGSSSSAPSFGLPSPGLLGECVGCRPSSDASAIGYYRVDSRGRIGWAHVAAYLIILALRFS